MKKYILNFINNVTVGILFVIATSTTQKSLLLGIITFLVAYIYLDLHSYIEKELGYPNNMFIN